MFRVGRSVVSTLIVAPLVLAAATAAADGQVDEGVDTEALPAALLDEELIAWQLAGSELVGVTREGDLVSYLPSGADGWERAGIIEGVSAGSGHYPIVDPRHVIGGRNGSGPKRVVPDSLTPSHFAAVGDRYSLTSPVEVVIETDTHHLTAFIRRLIVDIPDGPWVYLRAFEGTIEETSKVDGSTAVYPASTKRFVGHNRGDHIFLRLLFDGSDNSIELTLPKEAHGRPDDEVHYAIGDAVMTWEGAQHDSPMWSDLDSVLASPESLIAKHLTSLTGPATFSVSMASSSDVTHDGTLTIDELLVSGDEIISISGGLHEVHEDGEAFEGISEGWADIDPASASIEFDGLATAIIEFELRNSRYEPEQRYSWQNYDGDRIRLEVPMSGTFEPGFYFPPVYTSKQLAVSDDGSTAAVISQVNGENDVVFISKRDVRQPFDAANTAERQHLLPLYSSSGTSPPPRLPVGAGVPPAVEISSDGNTVVVLRPNGEGSARVDVADRAGPHDAWQIQGTFDFDHAAVAEHATVPVAVGRDGDERYVALAAAGDISVHVNDGTRYNWPRIGTIETSGPVTAMDFDARAEHLVVGQAGAARADLYRREGDSWSALRTLTGEGASSFGSDVSFGQNVLAVSADGIHLCRDDYAFFQGCLDGTERSTAGSMFVYRTVDPIGDWAGSLHTSMLEHHPAAPHIVTSIAGDAMQPIVATAPVDTIGFGGTPAGLARPEIIKLAPTAVIVERDG